MNELDTGFVEALARRARLKRDRVPALAEAVNRMARRLEGLGQPPRRTREVIARFVELMADGSGDGYRPRVSRYPLRDGFALHAIEPPCGGSTYILEKGDRLLFIDTGFACYARELRECLGRLFEDFDARRRACVVTHPDMDHCGVLEGFEAVWVSPLTYEHFRRENAGEPHFRDALPAHAPYCAMTRLVSRYRPPRMAWLRVIGPDRADDPGEPLWPLGRLDFCGLGLDVYRGNGGHAAGEIVVVDEADRLVFAGDLLSNPGGCIPPQAEYNRLSPYLMSSVNMNPALAHAERKALLRRFPRETYAYACGHGAVMGAKKETGDGGQAEGSRQ